MKLLYAPLLLLAFAVTGACTAGRNIHTPYANWYPGYAAWNEDTVLTWQFTIERNNRFTYTIKEKDSSGQIIQHTYKGTFSDSPDTVHLDFDKDEPARIASYLVKETSGHYLIQYFTDGRKRMFLHFVQLNRGFNY